MVAYTAYDIALIVNSHVLYLSKQIDYGVFHQNDMLLTVNLHVDLNQEH